MVMKAGANTSDKLRIRQMHLEGKYTDEQISATCSVKLPQVQAIMKSVDEGTFAVKGGANPSYGLGDSERGDVVMDPTAATTKVNESVLAEAESLKKQLEEAQAQIAEQAEMLEEATEADDATGDTT